MKTMKFYNGNEGIWMMRDLQEFEMLSATETELTLQYNVANLGAFDSARHAWEYKFIVDGVQMDFVDDPDTSKGNMDFVAGTITALEAYDDSGALIWEFTNLDVSLPLFAQWANVQEFNDAREYLYSGGLTISGSQNSLNSADGWDGDDLDTGRGNDSVNAGRGNDYIGDRGGSDTYDGGKGFDTVSYTSWFYDPGYVTQGIVADLGAGTATGPDGNVDTLISIEQIRGSFLADTLLGSGDDNRFHGMQGDDTIAGRGGFDIVDYRKDADQGGRFGVRVDLAKGKARDGFHDKDSLASIEGVRGTNFKDVIRDSKKDNFLEGNGGRDYLFASRGDDYLRGGADEDRFIFVGDNFGFDIISDYEDGIDRIKVENAATFQDLVITQDSTRSLITWNGNTIEVENTLATDLTVDDFIF